MYYVDSENELNDYFLDPNREISSAHLKAVCKFRQKDACRYISGVIEGGGVFVCMKKSPARATIDMWSRTDKFSAKEDNCEGLGEGYEKK